MLGRRGLLGGFVGLLAAPAVVRAASIMQVKAIPRSITIADFMSRLPTADCIREMGDMLLQQNAMLLAMPFKPVLQYRGIPILSVLGPMKTTLRLLDTAGREIEHSFASDMHDAYLSDDAWDDD